MHDEHPGTAELAHRLEAYASVRLAPNRASTARMRTALVEEARMRSLEASLRHGGRGRGVRRLAGLVLAAMLTIAGAATVAAAAAPGAPLYGVRLWLEEATLPASADARALERIHQIEARVLDVEAATDQGDEEALAAAIAAYRAAVDDAIGEAGADADRLDHLRAALGLHVVVLETIAENAPAPAMSAIERAIESSQKAVTKINATQPVHGGPDATPTPAATAKPGRTGNPQSSDRP